MNLMSSKKSAMTIAALQVLVFHLWIPLFPYSTLAGQAERFLISATYMGVDIFFFVSAYSLTLRPVTDYRSFVLSRAKKILPFFVIAYLLGHFLWFLPGLMVLYLLLPPLAERAKKAPAFSFFVLLAGWAAVTYLILSTVNRSQSLGIFLFRIPSIILGAYASGLDGKLSTRTKVTAGILLTVSGIYIVSRFGYMDKLDFPFRDTFYLTGIPLMLGILLLTDAVTDHVESRTFKDFRTIAGSHTVLRLGAHEERVGHPALTYLGSISLELYFVQVVLGTWLVGMLFGWTGSRLVTNLLSFAITIAVSAILSRVTRRLTKPKPSNLINEAVRP